MALHWRHVCVWKRRKLGCLLKRWSVFFLTFGTCVFVCYHGFNTWLRFHNTTSYHLINTLRPRRNEQHFTDDIFKRIFFNENVWISIEISLKFVAKGPINNIPALVQIMAWRRSGNKPLSEPMMVSLPTHICVTRPQGVPRSLHNQVQTTRLHNTPRWSLIVSMSSHLKVETKWPSVCTRQERLGVAI